jgi:hypothetical protein
VLGFRELPQFVASPSAVLRMATNVAVHAGRQSCPTSRCRCQPALLRTQRNSLASNRIYWGPRSKIRRLILNASTGESRGRTQPVVGACVPRQVGLIRKFLLHRHASVQPRISVGRQQSRREATAVPSRSNHNREVPVSHITSLPCPTPLTEAVDAGVFGFDLDGPLRPDAAQVRAITEEQAAELVFLSLDIDYLSWCQHSEVDPATGHIPKKRQRREELPCKLEHALQQAQRKYQDCLAAYGDAFGTNASDELDQYVRSVAHELIRQRDDSVQQQLF